MQCDHIKFRPKKKVKIKASQIVEAVGRGGGIPLSHLSFVQCDHIKFLPKKKVKIKASKIVEAVGRGGRGVLRRKRRGDKAVKHDMNFCNFFNLISFTISNKA